MKHFLTRLDHWIGMKIFIPPIIAFCHATRQNQHEAAGCFNVSAFLLLAYEISQLPPTFPGHIFFALFLFFAYNLYRAAFIRGVPYQTSTFFRGIYWTLAIGTSWTTLLSAIVGLDYDLYNEFFWLLILAGDYASSIGTLPPRKKRDSAKHAKNAEARS